MRSALHSPVDLIFARDARNASATLGYAIGRAWWGQGLATEAARAVLTWAGAMFGLRQIRASTDARNTGSLRVMEKLGMQRVTVRARDRVGRDDHPRTPGRWWARGRIRARVDCMSEHPRPGILEEALRLPADERLALATELLNSVEGSGDSEWDAAWLAEVDRRAQETADDPTSLEDWASVRSRLLGELRSK
jgi:putative addiction module component (TIGR02574 family)